MRRPRSVLGLATLCATLAGCGSAPGGGAQTQPTISPGTATPAVTLLSVFSPDIPGSTIPTRLTCDGADQAPRVRWTPAPASGTVVVQLLDPDAPGGTFTHWQVLGPAADLEGKLDPQLPPSAVVGDNDFGGIGYRGPCPPRGQTHRYHLVVTVVAGEEHLGPGFSRGDALSLLATARLVARGELVVAYGR